VAEHHDGFAMYDTALSEWNAAKMGPKRDIVAELAKSAQAQDMIIGVSNHRAEHWWFMDGGRKFDSDVIDLRYEEFYGPAVMASPAVEHTEAAWRNKVWLPLPDGKVMDDWLARCCEIVDIYQPQVFWFD